MQVQPLPLPLAGMEEMMLSKQVRSFISTGR